MKKILAALLCLGLTGCAENSGVVSIGPDTYMVSRQAATGFTGSGNLKAEAFQEANQYCINHGKQLQVVSTHEASPPYIFANFPKAEVQFMCLNANDPQLIRPRLEKEPDIVVKSDETLKANVDVQTNEGNGDLENKLKTLNDLLSKGLITQADFDQQKMKLLNEYTSGSN